MDTRSLLNPDIYMSIEQAIFQTENSDFHVEVAETLKELCKPLGVGFKHVTDMKGKTLHKTEIASVENQ